MARGHGKIILLGEHAVVYGHPALAAGISRGVTAAASPSPQPRLQVAPWNVDVTDTDTTDLARAFAVVRATYDTPPALTVRAEVGLPPGSGLGCSAALGVAIVRAIDEALGDAREDDAYVESVIARSLAWERVFHGNPSGVDNTMAARGGLALFRRGEPLVRVRARKTLRFVIGDSGEPSATKAMVDSVARQRERATARIDKTFDGIASLVRNGRLAVEAGDVVELGKLMDLNQALLNTLMLSTTRLEEMCALARAAGARGAKLTGGGGGGCMIALVDDDEVGARVREALAGIGTTSFDAEVNAT